MKFLKAEVAELDDEQKALLAKSIRAFIKAGGVITLTEWMDLTPVERAMYLEVRSPEGAVLEAAADGVEARLKSGAKP